MLVFSLLNFKKGTKRKEENKSLLVKGVPDMPARREAESTSTLLDVSPSVAIIFVNAGKKPCIYFCAHKYMHITHMYII